MAGVLPSPVDVLRAVENNRMWIPLSKPTLSDDPMPSTPAPPRGGESHEDYDRRCGPFVEINGRYYQKRLVEWWQRQAAREAEAVARAPKTVYTLHPRSRVMDMIMLASAAAFIAAAIWLAIAPGN